MNFTIDLLDGELLILLSLFKPTGISQCRLTHSTHQVTPKMAHLQFFVDIQYTQKGRSSHNIRMGCTIYTKKNLLLVLCVDDQS